MKRSFSTNRLFIITRNIVLIISSIALLLGISNSLTISNNSNLWLSELEECNKKYPKDSWILCSYYFELIEEQEQRIFYGFMVGLGLPIIFFSGVKLYEYLFPLDGEDIQNNK